jgi:hypothetical protein
MNLCVYPPKGVYFNHSLRIEMGVTMSFAKNFRQVAVPVATAITLAFAANANAAQPATVELDQLDLNKPVPNNVCFETNAKGTAFDKLKAAMSARSQIVVATANKAVVSADTPLRAEIFSSTSNGSEGYDIELSVPKDRMAETSKACLIAVKNINIYNVYTLKAVPPEVNKGELGVALRNGHSNGLKVMMTAQSNGGAILALQYNPARGGGALTSADASGNMAGDLGYMATLGYTPKAKELLGIKGEPQIVAMAPAPR